MLKSRSGFTLIELVIVIVLIGILSAVALPRFFNITENAHESSVNATALAMTLAMNTIHAKWLGMKKASEEKLVLMDLSEVKTRSVNIALNPQGWPIGASALNEPITLKTILNQGGDNDLICAQIMKNLLFFSRQEVGAGQACQAQYCARYEASSCIYVYHQGQKLERKIIYLPESGAVIQK